MTPYWLILGIGIIGSLFERPRVLSTRVPVLPVMIFAMVIIALFVGLRYQIGTDWYTYLVYYVDVSRLDIRGAVEYGDPAYTLLNWLSSRLDFHIWFVNLACAIIFCAGLYVFASGQTRPWLTLTASIPYLIIAVAMGYTRQSAAIGLVLVGLHFLLRRQGVVTFLVFSVLAATMHKSALMIVPIALAPLVWRKWWAIPLGLAVGAAGYFLLLRDELSALFDLYIASEYDSAGALIRVGLTAVPAAIFVAASSRMRMPVVEREIWLSLSLFSLAMVPAVLLSPSTTAIDRLGLYLIPVQLITISRIPDLLGGSEASSKTALFACLAYCAGIQFAWFSVGAYTYAWVPYYNYLQIWLR
ncbi:EpsG family protein [Brevundimonas sp. NPDC092305]|uniref:EpsG family protein n=1 Tax=Brevundimonas sp. NPDC092305 TaxID=3363957 RepID=UPI00381A77A2